jgi:glycerophosphoryl diester phosphodiesterase
MTVAPFRAAAIAHGTPAAPPPATSMSHFNSWVVVSGIGLPQPVIITKGIHHTTIGREKVDDGEQSSFTSFQLPTVTTMRSTTLFILVACLNAFHSPRVQADPADAAAEVRQIVAHRGASAERPECTLAALRRAIEAGATAVEVDIRTSRDGQLFLLHDLTLDRTTSGTGPAREKSMAELKKLDAGSWFDVKYASERIPTLREGLELCRGKIDLLLDLKEQGAIYAEAVAAEVRDHGDPKRTIIGVRSVEQAQQFRRLLPKARQLGLIANSQQIAAFAKAHVETIRLWPKWLSDDSLVAEIRDLGVRLHLNGTTGKRKEVLRLLMHRPYSLSSDDPATLVSTLRELRREGK